MNTEDKNAPAHPGRTYNQITRKPNGDYAGLTKREYAAIHIAAGLCSTRPVVDSEIVQVAIEVADELITKLEQ